MGRAFYTIALVTALIFHSVPAQAMTCVAYVRAVTGFDLSGNAWQWWNAAAGVYNRGHLPEPGAVMVFSRTHHMRDGHVAIVREVLGDREILIDQANWEVVRHRRGAISTAVRVVDVSPENDWSDVRVQWERSDAFGRDNPVSGFVYPDTDNRANISRARYLEARIQANRDDEEASAQDAVFTTSAGHHQLSHCAVTLRGAHHQLVAAEMASWRIGGLTGDIGALRPR